LGSDIVTVVTIGNDEVVPMTLHKTRLCSVSDFFKKAFDGDFKEAHDKQMELDDVEIHVFEGFVEWLYNGDITLSSEDEKSLDLLVDIYLFADRILCTGLKNSVMDHIQNVMVRAPGCSCRPQIFLSLANVEKIFENTAAEDSPIRKYCAAVASYSTFLHKGLEMVEDYFKVPGFLKEFSQYQRLTKYDIHDWDERYDDRPVPLDDPRIRGQRRSRDSEGELIMIGHPLCFFHVHAPDEKCKSAPNCLRVAHEYSDSDDD
jgi:hypothetical protein